MTDAKPAEEEDEESPPSDEPVRPRPVSPEFIRALRQAGARASLVDALVREAACAAPTGAKVR